MSYLTNAQKLRTAINDVGAMLSDEQALTWISDIDNNVWEPGAYGWSEVAE